MFCKIVSIRWWNANRNPSFIFRFSRSHIHVRWRRTWNPEDALNWQSQQQLRNIRNYYEKRRKTSKLELLRSVNNNNAYLFEGHLQAEWKHILATALNKQLKIVLKYTNIKLIQYLDALYKCCIYEFNEREKYGV